MNSGASEGVNVSQGNSDCFMNIGGCSRLNVQTEEKLKQQKLNEIKEKISKGIYFSDKVMSIIAEKLLKDVSDSTIQPN